MWRASANSLLIVVLFLSGCSTVPEGPRDHTVRVVREVGHTGFVLDRQRVCNRLPVLDEEFRRHRYLKVGWGDALYYQAETKTAAMTIHAGLYPSSAVLHVEGSHEMLQTMPPDLKIHEVKVTKMGYLRLLKYIERTFEQDSEGRPIKTGKGLHAVGTFYHANGGFCMFNTCNTWTARGLRKAGVPVSSFMTLRAKGVMDQLEEIEP